MGGERNVRGACLDGEPRLKCVWAYCDNNVADYRPGKGYPVHASFWPPLGAPPRGMERRGGYRHVARARPHVVHRTFPRTRALGHAHAKPQPVSPPHVRRAQPEAIDQPLAKKPQDNLNAMARSHNGCAPEHARRGPLRATNVHSPTRTATPTPIAPTHTRAMSTQGYLKPGLR